MERLPELRYEERRLSAGEGHVVMEYERCNPGETSYLVAETLVCKGGVITSSHVYHG